MRVCSDFQLMRSHYSDLWVLKDPLEREPNLQVSTFDQKWLPHGAILEFSLPTVSTSHQLGTSSALRSRGLLVKGSPLKTLCIALFVKSTASKCSASIESSTDFSN